MRLNKLDAHLGRFHQQLAAKEIADLLSRNFYASPANLGVPKLKGKSWPAGEVKLSVHRERPFAIRSGDEILTGSIDRLVVITVGGQIVAADVLDFKTDELRPGDAKALRAKADFYRPQIEAYRAAAARLLGISIDCIASRLVFLSAGTTCSL